MCSLQSQESPVADAPGFFMRAGGAVSCHADTRYRWWRTLSARPRSSRQLTVGIRRIKLAWLRNEQGAKRR